jgi:hypothetical protein
VRDRIDDGVIAAGGRAMPMAHLDYTDKGALMTLQVPSMAPGADALVHITLPRPAVPSDGFCDIGATEFLVDLA